MVAKIVHALPRNLLGLDLCFLPMQGRAAVINNTQFDPPRLTVSSVDAQGLNSDVLVPGYPSADSTLDQQLFSGAACAQVSFNGSSGPTSNHSQRVYWYLVEHSSFTESYVSLLAQAGRINN